MNCSRTTHPVFASFGCSTSDSRASLIASCTFACFRNWTSAFDLVSASILSKYERREPRPWVSASSIAWFAFIAIACAVIAPYSRPSRTPESSRFRASSPAARRSFRLTFGLPARNPIFLSRSTCSSRTTWSNVRISFETSGASTGIRWTSRSWRYGTTSGSYSVRISTAVIPRFPQTSRIFSAEDPGDHHRRDDCLPHAGRKDDERGPLQASAGDVHLVRSFLDGSAAQQLVRDGHVVGTSGCANNPLH